MIGHVPSSERSPTIITWDNFFSGDNILDWCAENGIRMMCAVNRGRLTKGVPSMCWNKSKTGSDDRSCAAGFENPIFAIKRKPEWGASMRQHCSFQSTLSCNIAHVNAINNCHLFAQQKQRGRKLFKRNWAIKMNESRQLHLSTCGKIDKIDHMIKNCNMHHRSWKCWHAPMNHAKALATVCACDFYLECSEGNLEADWKVDAVDFFRFREKLGMQMLKCDPRRRLCPGDEKFRVCTQQNKEWRRRTSPSSCSTRSLSPSRSIHSTSSCVGEDDLSEQADSSTRLCGFLDTLVDHQESVKRLPGTNGRVCVVCGDVTAMVCTKCGKTMHVLPPKNADTHVSCFMHCHNTGFFGLARDDCHVTRKSKKTCAFPSPADRKCNTAEMRLVHEQFQANRNQNNAGNNDNGDANSSD